MKNGESEPLVSVVTPVYNGERHLRQCIESVLRQTYANFEYIIRNNCSTDGTLEIAQEYERADRRIRVVDGSAFLPIIDNHNAAIAELAADSVYCKPLMADDCLYAECLAEMVAAARAAPEVGLVCCYASDGENLLWQGLESAQQAGVAVTRIAGRELARATLLGGPYVFGTPSSCLLRSDLVRKRRPFYDAANLHADHASCYDVLTESDCAFVHNTLVFNRVHPESHSSAVRASQSFVLGSLSALVKFGPHFLTGEEFAARLEERLESYYRMLASSFFVVREAGFWELHRRRLMELGLAFDKSRLFKGIFAELLSKFTSPIKAVRPRDSAIERRAPVDARR